MPFRVCDGFHNNAYHPRRYGTGHHSQGGPFAVTHSATDSCMHHDRHFVADNEQEYDQHVDELLHKLSATTGSAAHYHAPTPRSQQKWEQRLREELREEEQQTGGGIAQLKQKDNASEHIPIESLYNTIAGTAKGIVEDVKSVIPVI
mgnify:CR=1 FL=1